MDEGMVQSIMELRNVAGTEAAVDWAGGHTIMVDRPEGKAGGSGLGFNGGQLLALAIGGCYCNDLRYVAHELGVEIGEIAVTVPWNWTVRLLSPPTPSYPRDARRWMGPTQRF